MPIYVYECQTCGQIFEEIQKVGEEAPETPTDLSRCDASTYAGEPSPRPCKLERQLTTASHRFKNELSSDGIAGYKRQPGDVMVKQHRGKTGDFYGTDRAGRG